jgi:hypothetical protein
MIASLKSERLKTPNEGSKPEFYLRWIRELVPMNALVLTNLAKIWVQLG